MTDKAEVERAVAAMVAEQTAHGASSETIAAMIKLLRDDQESETTDKIPDDAGFVRGDARTSGSVRSSARGPGCSSTRTPSCR